MTRWFIILLLAASHASAGAWPRPKGDVFLYASTQINAPQFTGPFNSYTSIYAEYGLTEKTTIGLDVGHGVSGNSKLVVFMRYPILQHQNGHVMSAELGLGKIAGNIVVRPGLSYGYGFSTKRGSGWFAADIVLERHVQIHRTDFKADFTFGLNHSGRFKSILQLQTGKQIGDPSFARLAPSFVLPMGKNTDLEIGGTVELRSERAYGLKLGIWRKF